MLNKKLSLILMMLICIASALALPKPSNPADPFESPQTLSIYGSDSLPVLDITASENTLMGSECSNLYATSGEYCSGHVRVYFQCLPAIDGSQWEQRSENCADYPGGGRCVEEDGKAQCVDYAGTTSYGKKMLVIGIVLIVGGVLAGIYGHPIFFILVIMGVWLLIKMYLGGV